MSLASLKSWASAQWEWFKSFFSEETGGSTTRALNWIWMITLCINLTLVTSFNIYKHRNDTNFTAQLPPIEATSGYVALTTVLLAAKVGQRIWGENPVTGDVSGSVQNSSVTPTTSVSGSLPVTGSVG